MQDKLYLKPKHIQGNGKFICHIGNFEADQIESYYLTIACDELSEFGIQTRGFNLWLYCTTLVGN